MKKFFFSIIFFLIAAPAFAQSSQNIATINFTDMLGKSVVKAGQPVIITPELTSSNKKVTIVNNQMKVVIPSDVKETKITLKVPVYTYKKDQKIETEALFQSKNLLKAGDSIDFTKNTFTLMNSTAFDGSNCKKCTIELLSDCENQGGYGHGFGIHNVWFCTICCKKPQN